MTGPSTPAVRLLAFLVAALLGPSAAAVAEEEGPVARPPDLLWAPETHTRFAEPSALALVGDHVLVGDASGVWLLPAGEPPRRILRRGPVRDLAAASPDAVLVATDRGLYRVDLSGRRVTRLPLAAGERSSRATRVATLGGLLAVGTERGVYTGRDRLEALPGALGHGVVGALALVPSPAGIELWAAIEGRLRVALLAPDGTRSPAEALPAAPRGRVSRQAVDLGVRGDELVVLGERELAVRSDGVWRAVEPELPAGAEATRLGVGLGRVFVGTSGGLVSAPTWDGPFERTAPPTGTRAVNALAGSESRVLVVGPEGLVAGRRPSRGLVSGPAPTDGGDALAAPLPPDEVRARLLGEPPVTEVHRAALRYLDLGRARMRSLWRGVRRRGWLPELSVRGGYGSVRRLSVDQDQVVFSSGLQHDLEDRHDDRDRDYDVTLELSWDFGDVAFHPESIDVSREAREVVELRDEVLDEVTQLYFARRQALVELARTADPEARARLRLRADELAAGIDAWTGGWFGARVPDLAAPRRAPPAAPGAGSTPATPGPQETRP